MTYAALSSRSGVSIPTAKRILSGRAEGASFEHVTAIAEALGLSLHVQDRDIDAMRRDQARSKAEAIARLVQGTSALEGQAVDHRTFQRLVDQSYHELLAGSPRRLWSR